MTKVAFITGITGQDGSYLAELLIEKGYDVWGIIRRSSNINTQRIEHIFDKLVLRYGDLTDSSNLFNVLTEIKTKYGACLDRLEVYNLGAMSHVKVSFEMPEYTADVDGVGTLRLLEAIRNCGIPNDKVRFYQASTSEMYGKVVEVPQKATQEATQEAPQEATLPPLPRQGAPTRWIRFACCRSSTLACSRSNMLPSWRAAPGAAVVAG